MKAKLVCLTMGLVLSAIVGWAADANDRFKGGSHDGWAQATTAYARLAPLGTVISIH